MDQRNLDFDTSHFYKELINITNLDELSKVYALSLELFSGFPNVDMSMVYVVDKNSGEAVLEAYNGVPDLYLQRANRVKIGKDITWNIIGTGEPLISSNLQESTELGEAGRLIGIKSGIGIPLSVEGSIIGVIWFFSYAEEVFNTAQVDILMTMGKLVGTTIARLKQKEELTEKNRRLSIIVHLARYLGEAVNQKDLLNLVPPLIAHISIVDGMAVYIVDEKDGNRFAKMIFHCGIPDSIVKDTEFLSHSEDLVWKSIESGKTEYYYGSKVSSTSTCSKIQQLGIKAIVSVPIKLEQHVIGACSFLSYKMDTYLLEDRGFIEVLGILIGAEVAKIEMYENIKKASITDELTGLYNRRFFIETIGRLFAGSSRNGDKFSLILFDLDNFKQINDNYGHISGDRVLKEVGCMLRRNLRRMDLAARYGGDEFAVILPATGCGNSKIAAKRIYTALTSQQVDVGNTKIKPLLSMGISTFRRGLEDCNELIKMADEALYLAKKGSRKKIIHFDELKR